MADSKADLEEVMKAKIRADNSLSRLKEEQQKLAQRNAELAATAQVMTDSKQQADDKIRQLEKKFGALRQNLKGRPLKVDLPGGGIAQVSNALMNWGVESLGKRVPWVEEYADWLLGLPTTVSILAYVALAATRKESNGWGRDMAEEVTKISAHLGIKDVITALRKGRQKRVDQTKMAQDRVATLEAQNAQLLAQLSATAPKPQGKG